MNNELQQNLKMNITLDKTQEIKCKCGNMIFCEGILFRKISKILAGTDKDGLLPIPTYYCSKCGELLEELLPTDLKSPKIIGLS